MLLEATEMGFSLCKGRKLGKSIDCCNVKKQKMYLMKIMI